MKDKHGNPQDLCECGKRKLVRAACCQQCHVKRENLRSGGDAARRARRAAYMRDYNPIYLDRIKEEAFALLGGKQCALCGYADERALCFDHIDGGGTRERKQRPSRVAQIRAVLKGPERFRVLCWNCNWIAHVERKSEVA